jgi:hypothetical protein
MEISISKEVLPSVEEYGFAETLLGDSRRSARQYRNSSGLHIREYRDRFVVHEDRVDPRIDPIGHLIKDSPETLLAFGAAVFLSRNNTNADVGSTEHNSFSLSNFFLSFLLLNKIFGALKRLF